MFDNFIFAESQLRSIEEERIANSRHLEIAALCKQQQQQTQERDFNKDKDLPVLDARQRRFRFSIKAFKFLSAKK